jgi:hypothetical protein
MAAKGGPACPDDWRSIRRSLVGRYPSDYHEEAGRKASRQIVNAAGCETFDCLPVGRAADDRQNHHVDKGSKGEDTPHSLSDSNRSSLRLS